MHRIHARFSLYETARIRCHAPDPQNPRGQWKNVEGVRVKLSPAAGEPFGSATPSGSLEMVIASPEAAQVFNDAAIGAEFDAVLTLVESNPE